MKLRRATRLERLRRLLSFVPPASVLFFGLVAWEIVVRLAAIPSFILPGPLEVLRSGWAERVLLAANTLPTLEVALGGYLLALALGQLLAILIHFSRMLQRALYPLVVTSQTVPVVALAPVLVVALGFNVLPRLIIVCLICLFPVVVNTVDGLGSANVELKEMIASLRGSRWDVFRHVEMPGALPLFFSGAKVAAAYSVIGALFGEWAGSSGGLGYLMTQKQAQFDTPALFAAIVLLSILGILLFNAVSLVEKWSLPWRRTPSRSKALASGL